MLPLALLRAGDRAEIVGIPSHGCHADKCGAGVRIEEMGMRPGKTVEVLNNESSGPLLLKVDESRIALGRGLAMKIMVKK